MAGARDGERAPEHCWIVPGRLAAGAWPVPHLEWLAHQGVSVLINLTHHEYRDDRFRIHAIPVTDGAAPADAQILEFCRLVERELDVPRTVYVHCLAGCGRTGTMVACYLVYRDRLDPVDAMQRVRAVRPCAIETTAQVEAVIRWSSLMPASERRRPEP
ncbi:MAG TPA: dual specificity protein phosphatase family protein [Candidatus Methylomirabilis sp.]|nr:dual specificity protein phosphatase family protein [Candidatus Methylomirabilis sp.]